MRIVTITAELTGTTPLLMHNPQLSDPLNDFVRRMKKITSKPAKQKTDEDLDALSRIEWEGGLYFVDGIGPVIPYELVRKSLINGATMTRQGKAVEEAFISIPDRLEFDLAYRGPRTLEGMWEQRADFVDRRSVVVARSRVQRTRPRFNPWSLSAAFMLDTTRLDLEALSEAGERAGRFKGLGNGRSIGFGRYSFEIKEVEKL